MKNHRTTAPIIVLLATLAAAAPAAASASPLLSGYGGPGVGNQAILGSALLNGGGSTGGGSGPTGQGSGPASGAASVPTVAANDTAGERVARRAPRGAAPKGGGAKVSGVALSTYPASERGGAAPASGTLGLSGQDILFILLALLGLAFTGVFTRRLIGDAQREGTSS
jgi:hypothetical protein